MSRRARALAGKGTAAGGVKGKLKRLWAKKIAGVPAPIVVGGVAIAAYLVYRNRNQSDTDYGDEDAADFSAGVGSEGPITSGVGGGIGDGGVIGLPQDYELAYEQPVAFDPISFVIPRGDRRRRPRSGSRERVNRAALREARRRAIERYKKEQRERRQIIRRRIEHDRAERRQMRQRIENRRKEHVSPGMGGRGRFGPKPQGPPIVRESEPSNRRRRRERFRAL